MDILIKSFNRAYYLDRCLFSIFKHVQGFNGRVLILDDGTPNLYLEKIREKYPRVELLTSGKAKEKATKILKNEFDFSREIPTQFWLEAAKKSSDYFLMLEEDFWFTQNIDIENLEQFIKKYRIELFKLIWLGNRSLIGKDLLAKGKWISYQPELRANSLLYQMVFMKYNPVWRVIMKKIGFYSLQKELAFYQYYSVAGAIFKKDYFLAIWEEAMENVDEKFQILNALKYATKHQIHFGRSDNEVLKTGFVSSSFSKTEFSDFSIHDFNVTLNNFWLRESDFFKEDLSKDLSVEKIEKVLLISNKSELYIEEWKQWVKQFKEQYKKIGCHI